MKKCPTCKRTEDETMFYNGRNNYCRECWRERIRQYKMTDGGKESVRVTNVNRRNRYQAGSEYISNQLKKKERTQKKEKERKERETARMKQVERLNIRRNDATIECFYCGELKDNDMFWKNKNGVPRNDCKVCQLHKFSKMKKGKGCGNKTQVAHDAWRAVNAAIEGGELAKPHTCSMCDSSKRIQAHHEDYGKPLDVMWLCDACHRDVHRLGATTASCVH